jgi:predicted  nucleic acid-binding Zn-ribbon protein
MSEEETLARENQMLKSRIELLEVEISELQHKNSEYLVQISNLRDAIDGMADDMGQLEVLLAEARGEIE